MNVGWNVGRGRRTRFLMSAVWPIRAPAVMAQHLDEPREDVGERQEQQGGGALGADDVAEPADGVVGQRHEVGVRQLAALRPAGGAGGVDDRRDVVRAGGRAPALDSSASATSAPAAARSSSPPASICQTSRSSASSSRTEPSAAGVSRRLDDARRPPRSRRRIQLICSARRRLVDRHGDRAGGPDREVDERPLVAGPGHDARRGRRAATPAATRPAGDLVDVVRELAGRHVVPAVRHAAAEQHVVGLLGGLRDDQDGEVAAGGLGHESGDGELEHGGLLGRRQRQPTDRYARPAAVAILADEYGMLEP